MTSRLGSSIVLNRLFLVVLLVCAFSISAGMVMYITLRGRTVEVPNVIGVSEASGESMLEEYGLRMVVKSRIYSEKIPENSICDQYPTAGTVVKTGQLVRVSLSLGVQPVRK